MLYLAKLVSNRLTGDVDDNNNDNNFILYKLVRSHCEGIFVFDYACQMIVKEKARPDFGRYRYCCIEKNPITILCISLRDV